MLPKGEMNDLGKGPTAVGITLSPKALAMVTVHVFAHPSRLPASEDTDGVIDWAAEARAPVAGAVVQVASLVVEGPGLAEGCVTFSVEAPGYEGEERVVMLLLG